jgi:hypothetical protein
MAKLKKKTVQDRPRLAINGRPLTAQQEQDWRRANDDLGSGDFTRVKRGVDVLRRLESVLRAEQDAAGVRQGLADTIALERGRGEVVEVSQRAEFRGRVRIQTRDGLETLQKSGTIDGRQFKAGMVYRELYEAADPERDLRSQMADLDRRGSAGAMTGVSEAWQERRLRLAGAMAAIEDKVRIADRSGRAVSALREVAGHARCVSHLVNGGGAQLAYRRALGLALDVAADHLGLR